MSDTDTTTEPRAWVGCLACYNAGHLVGEWVDGREAGDSVADAAFAEAVHAGFAMDEPISAHEEWWVMDHEGYGSLIRGECSPAEAQAKAELLDEVDEDQRAAFLAYVDNEGEEYGTVERFTDAYLGEWGSALEYAEEYIDSTGILGNVDELASRYFDYRAFARDLELGGDIFTMDAPGGAVYVFDGHA